MDQGRMACIWGKVRKNSRMFIQVRELYYHQKEDARINLILKNHRPDHLESAS